jgi:hypothetical protein
MVKPTMFMTMCDESVDDRHDELVRSIGATTMQFGLITRLAYVQVPRRSAPRRLLAAATPIASPATGPINRSADVMRCA